MILLFCRSMKASLSMVATDQVHVCSDKTSYVVTLVLRILKFKFKLHVFFAANIGDGSYKINNSNHIIISCPLPSQ